MYRLLVVDDEKDIRENIRYLTDWARYGITQLETAANYEEAVNKALDFRPHIILMDVSLGGGHWGYELVERLRASGLNSVCGMISGYDDFVHMQRSMQASAKDYLLKPIDRKDLERFIERAIVEELKGELPERKEPAPDMDPILKVRYESLSKITNKIIMIIKSDYRNPLSLISIGEMFCMSSKYIGRIFLQDTGMKFTEYLMAYRMVQARRLIETTGDKIVVIAGQVGYTQLNNFYVHFKEYYGVSPSALRETEGDCGTPPRAAETASPGKTPEGNSVAGKTPEGSSVAGKTAEGSSVAGKTAEGNSVAGKTPEGSSAAAGREGEIHEGA